MVELLAPAGTREALIAAVENGADAVYLGGKQFGARHYADNFSEDELRQVVRYSHLQGTAIYVTVNTLVDNSEMPQLLTYLRDLYEIGVDGIIVQDLGVARAARKVVPHLPLHASTQMTVHNLNGVHFLQKEGFSRVVLARELSLDEIRNIVEKSSIEIEVFIHGALCICYSGQCLMSSMIGGRSGNRGRCAQPCRLPYTLVDEHGRDLLDTCDAGEYLLSPRDLKTIDLLPQLIDAGVTSFKIEGRMKRPEYVAVVVDNYRKSMDQYLQAIPYTVHPEQHRELEQIFNRDFTTAYLIGKQGKNMMSDRRPNNRGVRIGRVTRYSPDTRTVLVKLDRPLSIGDGIEFWVKVGGRTGTIVNRMLLDGIEVEAAPPASEVEIPVEKPVRPGDRVFRTFDNALMNKARRTFQAEGALRRIPVDVNVSVREGQPLTIFIQDSEEHVGEAHTEFIAEKAIKRPLTNETVHKQIDRMGNTLFSLKTLRTDIVGDVMVPVSEINEARRKAIAMLEEARLARWRKPALDGATYQLCNTYSQLL